jgi:hypothetical protein
MGKNRRVAVALLVCNSVWCGGGLGHWQEPGSQEAARQVLSVSPLVRVVRLSCAYPSPSPQLDAGSETC